MSELKKLLQGVEVEWKALGEVASFANGKGHEKVISQNGKYIVVNSKFVSTEGKVAKYSNEQLTPLYINDILIVMSDLPYGRALAKTYFVDEDNRYTLNQRIGRITVINTDRIIPRYLNYLLNRTPQLLKYDNGIDQTNLKKTEIQKVLIPIPCPDQPEKSLKIQEEIVRILDNLSEETSKLTSALQNELDSHQKRYEYYREELFKLEVELKSLGEEGLGQFVRGSGLQKKDFTDSGVGCIHYGQVYTHYGIYTYNTKSFVSEEFAKTARRAKTGDIIIATTSENDEDVCKAVAWLGSEDIAVSSDACFYRHNLNPKYVAYYFLTEQFQSKKRKYITGIKVRRVNANDLAKISIPVPSIEEQNRIVEILDEFDAAAQAITTEIKKEIELRNRQFEYYRDLLLTFPK